MQLQLFKTLWGFDGSYQHAITQCLQAGMHGLEGAAPENTTDLQTMKTLLENNGIKYIAEITTAGIYV